MTVKSQPIPALIDRWFPVAAVDEACGTPAGSGQNEKAIFTWFASRPIAQARAAVLCSLLPDPGEDDAELRSLVEDAIKTGDAESLVNLSRRIPDAGAGRPVVLDCFSGRGIIPLEAARLGLRAVGTDLSPVAVLASRLLGEWPLVDWSSEPEVQFAVGSETPERDVSRSGALFELDSAEPKLLRDLRQVFAEVGRRVAAAVVEQYPANADGSTPWGYLWAITIPCDSCRRPFPLLDSLVLRHPYVATGDEGQSLLITADDTSGEWTADIHDGMPVGQPTYAAPPGRKGKSARCPFCAHVHATDAVKAKGFAGQYVDVPLAAADLVSVEVQGAKGRRRTIERKVFRCLRSDEVRAATSVSLGSLEGFGTLAAAPSEVIAQGNKDSVRGTGYGCSTWSSLMNDRQVYLFVETVRAIRSIHRDVVSQGASEGYAAALASFAASNLVRRLRRATRGAALEAYGDRPAVGVSDIFTNQSAVAFGFSWLETGPGLGPGTWASLTETTLTPLRSHLNGLTKLAEPGRFRRASATALPYRDGTVDAVVCDPPYYSMIDYADVSDLFYVWLRRCLFDIVPDLFGEAGDEAGLQDKSQEIIVKRSPAPTDHRTTDWYETQLSSTFTEMRRVLKPGGTLAVVFGHSDPDAWRRLLGALRDAGFVVTSAWPARTESGTTGVASIKVTVTIGCRVAPEGRTSATSAHVEREIAELVHKRVKKWEIWNLALSDQLMASYGPAMQVVGRYRNIQRPDGTEPDLDHFLAIGRRAVADAHTFKVDELPLDTFDPYTRFAIFWMRTFGRTAVNKGEAVFHAQSSQMRIEVLRPSVIDEVKGGYALTLVEPPPIGDNSPVIHVARALAAAWPRGATEAAAEVLADSGRTPDDPHVWAMVGELVNQLPESDKVSMALTACQRNRRSIESAARHAAVAQPEQLTIDSPGEAS